MKTVLITGGTGLIGSHLAPILKEKGFRLHLLSRSGKPEEGWDETFQWDPGKGEIDRAAFKGVTHIIHLAGAGIAEKRWTDERKKLIRDSRIKSSELLLQTLKLLNQRIGVYVSGSAVGWYGAQTDQLLHTEAEPAASDFLGDACRLWEHSADQFQEVADRIVKIRTGVVLGKESGALPEMAKPFQLFVGSPLGSGRQQVPWIHISDICRIFAESLENASWRGSYNASATENCSNREFSKALAGALNRPMLPVAVPSFILKMLLGEMSAVVLEGSRISNYKILDCGFQFMYIDLKAALANLLS